MNSKAPEGIAEITVSGFKSIATRQSIEVRPLTILAGANSSGKTSFLQPLLLLKQTLEAPYDPGPLLLDGPNVKLTSGEQVLSRLSDGACGDSFGVGMGLGTGWSLELSFAHERGKGFHIRQMTMLANGKETKLRPGMTEADIGPLLSSSSPDGVNRRIAVARERCFLGWTA